MHACTHTTRRGADAGKIDVEISEVIGVCFSLFFCLFFFKFFLLKEANLNEESQTKEQEKDRARMLCGHNLSDCSLNFCSLCVCVCVLAAVPTPLDGY
jgi:hypothetical protein